MPIQRVLILSDIHYAGAAEQTRRDFEHLAVDNRLLRQLLRFYRHFIWLRDPLGQNHLLDQFLERAGEPDLIIANGDYTCDSAFVGVSDDAACESARLCLEKLRARFGPRFHATFGDHELGKVSLAGGKGGVRLTSWQRAVNELKLEPFWQREVGRYVLIGVTSSLLAWPVNEPDALPAEVAEWRTLREAHRREVREAFAALHPEQRVLLFCHDPTALPFLWEEAAVRARLGQIEQTIIGHLHSPLLLWKCRRLAGIPVISWLGHSTRRFTRALNAARLWEQFHPRLCPSLAGIELLKDGGYLEVELDESAAKPARWKFHGLAR